MESRVAKGGRARAEAEQDFVLDAQFLLLDAMAEKGITKAELARRAGISRARLSQLLRAEANPTLRTLVNLFSALGERVEVKRASATRDAFAHGDAWGCEAAPEQKSMPTNPFNHKVVSHLSKVLSVKSENYPTFDQFSNDDVRVKRIRDLQVA